MNFLEYRVRSSHENNCSYYSSLQFNLNEHLLCSVPLLRPNSDQAAAFTVGFWDSRQDTAVTYMAPTDTQHKVGGKQNSTKEKHCSSPRQVTCCKPCARNQTPPSMHSWFLCPQFHLLGFQLPIVSYSTKLLRGKFKKQFLSFKLCHTPSCCHEEACLLSGTSSRELALLPPCQYIQTFTQRIQIFFKAVVLGNIILWCVTFLCCNFLAL